MSAGTRLFSYAKMHRKRKAERKEEESIKKKHSAMLHSLIRMQSICVAVILRNYNPHFLSQLLLEKSGNPISSEDIDVIRRGGEDWKILVEDDFCKDVIVGLLDWFNRNQATLYYSSRCGFGVFASKKNTLEEEEDFLQPAKDELSGCAEEAQAWGRVWDSNEGDLHWSYGFPGLLNHSCSKHATLDCDVKFEDKLIRSSFKRHSKVTEHDYSILS